MTAFALTALGESASRPGELIQVENFTPEAGGGGGWGRNGLSPSSSGFILASPRSRSQAFRLSEHFCVSGSTMPVPHWYVTHFTTRVRCRDPSPRRATSWFVLSVGFGPRNRIFLVVIPSETPVRAPHGWCHLVKPPGTRCDLWLAGAHPAGPGATVCMPVPADARMCVNSIGPVYQRESRLL